jgi:hypothetical protein
LLWQGTELHVPPPHVPFPHCALDVHAIGVHVAAHVPPLQSALLPHSQAFLTHRRPVPQSLLMAHVLAAQAPVVAPEHV